MSEIYLATQLSLDRTVAVKIARAGEQPGRANWPPASPARRSCWRSSTARTSSRSWRPGRCPSGDGVLGWIAMEYQAGGDLARWLRAARPAAAGTRPALVPAGAGGAALRPPQRRAAPRPEAAQPAADRRRQRQGRRLRPVQAGRSRATPAGRRRPPSTARRTTCRRSRPAASTLDERSDIFSLGTTFFHLFSGQLPFEHDSAGGRCCCRSPTTTRRG